MPGLKRDIGKAPFSRGGPASGSPRHRRRRVEFVVLSDDVYSSVLDELEELSWLVLRLVLLLLPRVFLPGTAGHVVSA